MMRITVWPSVDSHAALQARLDALSDVDVAFDWVGDEAALEASLVRADALLIGAPHLSARVLTAIAQAPRLKWLQVLNAGLDRITPGSLPASLIVCNASAALAPTVAEHALSLLLALGRQLGGFYALMAQARWDKTLKARQRSLRGATLVIVGFGAIGRALAEQVRPFKCHIIAVTRSGAADPLADETIAIDQLDTALARADAIAVTLPLTTATAGLFNAQRFAACRKQPLFVNVARGPIVDSHALEAALRAGTLGGAALDVTDPEPLPDSHPLWSVPNLLITPHVAAAGGYDTLAEFIAVNVQRYARGEEPHSRVSL
jgi:phosphoglycerate dehydrogenase-like enzyme